MAHTLVMTILGTMLGCRLTHPESDQVAVVVAARDLWPGVEIGANDVYGIPWDASRLPPGVFVTPTLVVGRVSDERILANELVRGERLADRSSGIGFNGLVPRGMRAISVTPSAPLEPALQPGQLVNVLNGTDGTVAVRAVVVMGVPSSDPLAVTLLTQPHHALEIAQVDRAQALLLERYVPTPNPVRSFEDPSTCRWVPNHYAYLPGGPCVPLDDDPNVFVDGNGAPCFRYCDRYSQPTPARRPTPVCATMRWTRPNGDVTPIRVDQYGQLCGE